MLALAFAGLFVAVNGYFLRSGLLVPDFAVIARAFAFNLGWLPAGLWLTGLFLLIGALPLFPLRRPASVRSWRRWGLLFLIAGTALAGLRIWVNRIEPRRLVVRTLNLPTDKLTRPVRILHLSDIQAGSVGRYEERIFEQVRNLAPDLILFTGDWLQPVPPATFDSEWPKLQRLIDTLNPPLGLYAVYGDTDGRVYHLPDAAVGAVIRMEARPYRIRTSGGTIHLRGLGLFQSRYPDLARRHIEAWLEDVPDSAFSLLIGHGPDFLIGLEDLAIDLCLAGHTHGGQVRLPGLGPLVTQSAIPAAWSRGFHRHGRTRFHVSAGAGSVRHGGLPEIRFNCPTEMTLITLVPDRPQASF